VKLFERNDLRVAAWWNIEARLDQFDTQDEFDEVLLYIPQLNKENDFTS
jgi:hypothetical protein